MQKFKSADNNEFKIGVISDTHGLFRPEIKKAFNGVNLIIHAGDMGKPEVIQHMEEIAPVIAVRGNVDGGNWCSGIPYSDIVNIDNKLIYLIHNINEFDYTGTEKLDVVIFGHSHKPLIEYEDDVLYFNPGSAGPQRFSLPISAGKLIIRDNKVFPQHIDLK